MSWDHKRKKVRPQLFRLASDPSERMDIGGGEYRILAQRVRDGHFTYISSSNIVKYADTKVP